MHGLSRFLLWIGLVIAIVLGVLWQFIPLPDAKERMNTLPLIGLEYQGRNIPLTSFEKEFLKGINVINRQYVVGDQNFFITVLDGTYNRHAVHDPYYCFKGAGWSVVSEKEYPIKNGHAMRLLISKDGEEREAMFWFSGGKEHYVSPMKYWLQTTLRRMSLGVFGAEPLLIVVQPIHEKKVDWERFEKQLPSLFEL